MRRKYFNLSTPEQKAKFIKRFFRDNPEKWVKIAESSGAMMSVPDDEADEMEEEDEEVLF